ncbi:MAG: hypothetical protein R2909_13155 [Gemmatimonadales bacterium]
MEKMKGESLRGLSSDSGKPGQLADQRFDGAERLHRPSGNGMPGTFLASAWAASPARRCASAMAERIRSASSSGSRPSEGLRIDHQLAHQAATVGLDPNQPATGGRLDRSPGKICLQLLQATLHLLAQL